MYSRHFSITVEDKTTDSDAFETGRSKRHGAIEALRSVATGFILFGGEMAFDQKSVEGNDLLSKAESECLRKIDEDNGRTQKDDNGELFCSAFWDGWGCWNSTAAGATAFIPCPPYRTGFDPRLTAHRDCNSDGTWWKNPITKNVWANYTTCINVMELEKSRRVIFIYVVGYSVSMVFLILSIAIFVFFRRQLKCDRVTIHQHLFSSFVLNGIAWILYYVLAALNASVIASNPRWCRWLHVVTQYFVMCNFAWMFCEGCYLHTIVVLAFTDSRRLLLTCCVTGWGFPIVTTSIYAVARCNSNRSEEWQQCWMMESPLQWIVSGPIVVTLIMNLIFLCNIVRVLVIKLRAINSPETVQTKKAVKATLILIPLLGLQFSLFPMRPSHGSTAEEVYQTIIALVTSLQGVFVALLFCLMNGEVVGVLRRRWKRQWSSFSRRSSSNDQRMIKAKEEKKKTIHLRRDEGSCCTVTTPTSPNDTLAIASLFREGGGGEFSADTIAVNGAEEISSHFY